MLVRALGPLQVQPDASAAGRDPDPPSLGGPRQRAVLACLVVHAGEPVAASTVVDAVWPDGAPTTSHGSLQAYVSRLRSVLGRDRLRHVDGAYALRLDRNELDEAYVAGLDALHVRALCAAATCCLDAGEPDAAVDLLRPGIVEHPHDEDLVFALMRAYAHAGRAEQALSSYRALRDRLRDDLGARGARRGGDRRTPGRRDRARRCPPSDELPGPCLWVRASPLGAREGRTSDATLTLQGVCKRRPTRWRP